MKIKELIIIIGFNIKMLENVNVNGLVFGYVKNVGGNGEV
jgi:hypothetical protein